MDSMGSLPDGIIREAGARDLSRIAEILVFGKRMAYRALFQDDRGSFSDLQVLSVAAAYRADPSLLGGTLVCDDGIVKGLLRRRYAENAQEAELCELYVDPFFTGQGIGHALAAHFLQEAEARGAQRITLWVIAENAGARRFYEAIGFVPDGEMRPVGGTFVQEMRYSRVRKHGKPEHS